jgi:hypothetical protein
MAACWLLSPGFITHCFADVRSRCFKKVFLKGLQLVEEVTARIAKYTKATSQPLELKQRDFPL